MDLSKYPTQKQVTDKGYMHTPFSVYHDWHKMQCPMWGDLVVHGITVRASCMGYYLKKLARRTHYATSDVGLGLIVDPFLSVGVCGQIHYTDYYHPEAQSNNDIMEVIETLVSRQEIVDNIRNLYSPHYCLQYVYADKHWEPITQYPEDILKSPRVQSMLNKANETVLPPAPESISITWRMNIFDYPESKNPQRMGIIYPYVDYYSTEYDQWKNDIDHGFEFDFQIM